MWKNCCTWLEHQDEMTYLTHSCIIWSFCFLWCPGGTENNQRALWCSHIRGREISCAWLDKGTQKNYKLENKNIVVMDCLCLWEYLCTKFCLSQEIRNKECNKLNCGCIALAQNDPASQWHSTADNDTSAMLQASRRNGEYIGLYLAMQNGPSAGEVVINMSA